MNTLSELEREAYRQQNRLALDIFARLDYLYRQWDDKQKHPLEMEERRIKSGTV